jgi:DNA mismatch endonuclease (patch repair protein)
MDVLTPEERRKNMSAIRGKDTRPELAVRSALHRFGFRFRIHVDSLPGRPDIVLPKYRAVVFVHGCFWHRHPGCRFASTPASRPDFWRRKFEKNLERDRRAQQRLREQGWVVFVVWECEAGKSDSLAAELEQIRFNATRVRGMRSRPAGAKRHQNAALGSAD